MNIEQALLLGVLQGLTEFLPVSSSGHLTILQNFWDLRGDHITFDIAVHLGTVLSILVIYRKNLWKLMSKKAEAFYLLKILLVASLPTAVMGLGLRTLWESLFKNLPAVGCSFIVTGCLLYFSRRKGETSSFEMSDLSLSELQKISPLKAAILGVAQGFAITPGISRSGSTIATALILGIPRSLAAFFSFIMSIPAILGASLLELRKVEAFGEGGVLIGIGLISAFFAGLLGLLLVLRFVRKGKLEVFSPYLWLLGVGVLIYSLF